VLELAKAIHEAIGIESPVRFVLAFALLGFFVFGGVGWIVDRGYRVKLREQLAPKVTAESGIGLSAGKSTMNKKNETPTRDRPSHVSGTSIQQRSSGCA
jgi:hypothetical protein